MRPLRRLLLDLELEDERPREAEDEGAVAIDEIFGANVDQLDVALGHLKGVV